MNHFYVHIPFCHRICPYCKFAVSPVVNELTKKRYLEYLKKEIVDFFEKDSSTEIGVWKNKDTLYFWWWTPSILSTEELWDIFKCFGNSRDLGEVTLESNPEDITEEKVKSWKSLWVNRVSLWVQSLDDIVLGTIKRANQEITLKALEILNKHFENVNIDLILGLPYSKPWETLAAIRELHSKFSSITHTSVYILEDERYPREWKEHYPTEEQVQIEYSDICDYLGERWWHHYEISNWAKPWYESIHNQSYWNHSGYRGFWLSAGSYMQERRFANASNFRDYFAGKREQETLTEEQVRIEKVMFGLRTFSLDESLIGDNGKLEKFLREGLLQKEGEKIFPTKTWIFMLDYIMSELV